MFPFRSFVLVLCSAAAAQATVVSPAGLATVEGSSGNAYPWNSPVPRRYLQLHGDLGPAPRVITALSFRVNADAADFTGTRTHDIEVWMGEGRPALEPRFRFDDNYVGPRTLVLPRTTVTFGPQGNCQLPGPSAFTGMDLVLATPFAYSGQHSLVWEVVYYGQVAATGLAGTYTNCDAEQGIVTPAPSNVTGGGCVATGQGTPMSHALSCYDVAGTLVLNATVGAAPPGAPCVLALGAYDPAATWPGLCTVLRTDASLILALGTANALGDIGTDTPALTTFTVPNIAAGFVLKSQVVALDAARQQSLGVCLSDGRSAVLPTPDTTRTAAVSRVFNNVGGTSASEGVFYPSTVGYGLVVRFTCQ
jgi:hypothetical protein